MHVRVQGFCESCLASASSQADLRTWPNVLVGAGAP